MMLPDILAMCLDKAYPTEFPEPKVSGLGANFRKAYKILEKIDELRHKNIAIRFIDYFFGLRPLLEEVLVEVPLPYRLSNVLHLNFESMYQENPVNLYINTKCEDSNLVMEVGIQHKDQTLELPFADASKEAIFNFLKKHSLESSISKMYFNQFWLILGKNRTVYCLKNEKYKEYMDVFSRFPSSFYFLPPSTPHYKCRETVSDFMKYSVIREMPIETSTEEKTPHEKCFLNMIYVFRRINEVMLPMISQALNARPMVVG